ncbi:MAG TPA: hypothetical protein VIK86_02815 [Candidatus Paceibacterota bacterium]
MEVVVKSVVAILKFIDNHANLLLVLITGVYAFLTYKMVETMKNQSLSKITVSNIFIKSIFNRKDVISGKTKISSIYSLRFELFFDIKNSSSGSGSIDKPLLILKYTNKGFNIKQSSEYILQPVIKDQECVGSDDCGSGKLYRYKDINLGATIFLRGGESDKVQIYYTPVNNPETDENIETFGNPNDLINSDLSKLEYFIRYNNNLGKNYEIKIEIVSNED